VHEYENSNFAIAWVLQHSRCPPSSGSGRVAVGKSVVQHHCRVSSALLTAKRSRERGRLYPAPVAHLCTIICLHRLGERAVVQ
jgi:hypothetical protein